MDNPAPPRFPPLEDQPDELLAELHQAQVALRTAEYHLRLWRANSATGNIRAYRAYAAHEALDEAGRVIDCIAETLLIEAAGTLTTPYLGHPAQIRTEVSPTDAAAANQRAAVTTLPAGNG